MKKALIVFLSLLLLVPVLAGAETVVTSFYPIWILTLSLTDGVDGVEVVNLAEPSTGCLHDYSLQNSDMVVLSGADALLVNGAGMETFLPVIAAACPDLPVIDATAGLPFLSESGIIEIGDSEDSGIVNSHLWMDPQRAAGMAANLADGLVQLLPDKAEQIMDNLEQFRNRLLALDETLRNEMKDTYRNVIVFHEAFPYFAEACGLRVAAVVNKEPEDELSSAGLSGILALIAGSDPLPLIIKSTETDRSVEVLVAETGIAVCELDPLTSGPDNPPSDYYETVMLHNMRLLQNAMK